MKGVIMAEIRRDPAELARQAQGHLRSLRLAGVEWLPLAMPPAEWSAAAPAQTLDASAAAPLFSLAAATGQSMPLEQRRQALHMLAKEVAGCTRCPELACTRTQTVFADGSAGAELCFIGEAPGADEDAQGLPFVGAAGELLNKIIAACGLKREEGYICNILQCRPPANRTPLPHE